MSRKTWEDGYKDGHVGRDSETPPKPIFDPEAKDRYDYKYGYEKGERDRKDDK
jgi:hypothetical protein